MSKGFEKLINTHKRLDTKLNKTIYENKTADLKTIAQSGDIITNAVSYISQSFLIGSFLTHSTGKKKKTKDSQGITRKKYIEQSLEKDSLDLALELQRGHYLPREVSMRTRLKANGGTRVIKNQANKDKLAYSALTDILYASHEHKFKSSSYAYIKGRNVYQAVEYWRKNITETKKMVLIKLDAKNYFDTIPHDKLLKILAETISDPIFLRHVRECLRAGIKIPDIPIEEIEKKGLGQGLPMGPVLSNIYMDRALDSWFLEEFQHQFGGRCFKTRYGDDIIIGLEVTRKEADNAIKLVQNRLVEFGIPLNQRKTRIYEIDLDSGLMPEIEIFGFLVRASKDDPRQIQIDFPEWKLNDKLGKVDKLLRKVSSTDSAVTKLRSSLTGWFSYYSFKGCKAKLDTLHEEANKKLVDTLEKLDPTTRLRLEKPRYRWDQGNSSGKAF